MDNEKKFEAGLGQRIYDDALQVANEALALQISNSEQRAAELLIANDELAFQNQEKEKRAFELLLANKELAYQNQEKEKRASELLIDNAELAFQNQEKENRAYELLIANEELAFQNQEKEKRASELITANIELAFQMEEKGKRAAELLIANKELESFNFISSHDLQEPLRKIQYFSDRIQTEELENLSDKGKHYFERMQSSALHMQTLINDLLAYSRINSAKRTFVKVSLKAFVEEELLSLSEDLKLNNATIEITSDCFVSVIPFQFKQLLQNLITNSLKFSKVGVALHITISSTTITKEDALQQQLPLKKEYCHIRFSDNGIGFDTIHSDRIFELFQRLHGKKAYSGTGIGLTIVKKIVENHNGIITARGQLNESAQFDIYIPAAQN